MTRKGKGKGKGKGKSRRQDTPAPATTPTAAGTPASAQPVPAKSAPVGTTAGRRTGRGEDVAAPLARWFLWVDSPLAVHRLILGLGALCALLFLFDIVWHRHAYVPGEGLWGFHAIAGFVSFTVIVLGAKALRTVIGRDEDYYGAAAIDGEHYPERGLGRLDARAGEEAGSLLAVRDGRAIGPLAGQVAGRVAARVAGEGS